MKTLSLSLAITFVLFAAASAAPNPDPSSRSSKRVPLSDITRTFGIDSASEKQLIDAKSALISKRTAHDSSHLSGYALRLLAALRRLRRRSSSTRSAGLLRTSRRTKLSAVRQVESSASDRQSDRESAASDKQSDRESAASDAASAASDAASATEDGSDDDDVCFPAGAKVNVQGKGIVDMSSLDAGDRVQVASGEFSSVYTFSHRVPRGMFEFVQLVTARGTISLTSSHYIRADGVMTAAGNVKTGSLLERGDGSRVVVESIKRVLAEGLYNPHTLSGDIVVDGFVASTFTRAVEPVTASALLTPVRAVFRVMGIDMAFGLMDQGASRGVLDVIPGGGGILSL